ncbi:hypothetical protein [Nocardioides sp.]|uniref:hypothetical protein n=1 Tax=Nocardioides sp. TaxID=35761 RepID=UPI002B26CAC6|nr:hypothetical protein [Nocardioides sp.]
MRSSRLLLVALLALVLLGLVPAGPGAAGAAGAAVTTSDRTVPAASAAPLPSSAASARARARTKVKKLTGKIVRRQGKLFLTGVIRPKKGPVQVQKATSCNQKKGTCNFKKYRKAKINKKGRYTMRVYAPTTGSWVWRARKNATYSPAWVTCVKKPNQDCPAP